MTGRARRVAHALANLARVMFGAPIALLGLCGATWAALFRCPVLAVFFCAAGALGLALALLPRRLGRSAIAGAALAALIALAWRVPVREVHCSIARLAAIPRTEDTLERFSLRDKLGIYGLNLAMGAGGLVLYPEAARETLWLAVPAAASRRRVFRSDFPMLSQRIRAVVRSFEDRLAEAASTPPQFPPQRVAWPSGSIPSSPGTAEWRVRLALDPCDVHATARRAGAEWVLDVEVEVRVAYPKRARTCLLRDPELCVEEGLFWVLQATHWLHPYTAVWTFSRRVPSRARVGRSGNTTLIS